MKRVNAAEFLEDLEAWAKQEMIGVGQQQPRAAVSQTFHRLRLTVAWVPTGMKTGVWTAPWSV